MKITIIVRCEGCNKMIAQAIDRMLSTSIGEKEIGLQHSSYVDKYLCPECFGAVNTMKEIHMKEAREFNRKEG